MDSKKLELKIIVMGREHHEDITLSEINNFGIFSAIRICGELKELSYYPETVPFIIKEIDDENGKMV